MLELVNNENNEKSNDLDVKTLRFVVDYLRLVCNPDKRKDDILTNFSPEVVAVGGIICEEIADAFQMLADLIDYENTNKS